MSLGTNRKGEDDKKQDQPHTPSVPKVRASPLMETRPIQGLSHWFFLHLAQATNPPNPELKSKRLNGSGAPAAPATGMPDIESPRVAVPWNSISSPPIPTRGPLEDWYPNSGLVKPGARACELCAEVNVQSSCRCGMRAVDTVTRWASDTVLPAMPRFLAPSKLPPGPSPAQRGPESEHLD